MVVQIYYLFEPVEAIRALEKTSKDTSVIVIITSTPIHNKINKDVNYPNIDDILSELDSKVAEVYSFDANKIALNAGHPLSMNMAMVGASTAISSFPLDKEDVITTMKDNLPPKSIDINLKAFEDGYNCCK